VRVVFVIQNAIRMRHVAVYAWPRSAVIFHYVSQKGQISKKTLLYTKCVF